MEQASTPSIFIQLEFELAWRTSSHTERSFPPRLGYVIHFTPPASQLGFSVKLEPGSIAYRLHS